MPAAAASNPYPPTAPAAQPRVTASLLANIALKRTLTVTMARTRHAALIHR